MIRKALKSLLRTPNEEARVAWVKRKLAALPPGSRLLDAGAGERRFRDDCRHLTYVSQDFCQYDGSGDRAGLQTGQWNTSAIDIVCDITAIPEPDASFDAVLCTEVIEHVPDPTGTVRELARLLRPGGTLIMTAPFASLTHFAPYHFYSGFNRYFFEHWLAKYGLIPQEISPNGNYMDFLSQELVRLREVSSRYGPGLGILGTSLALLLAARLRRAARRDRGSSELLCFGYHVEARKASEI